MIGTKIAHYEITEKLGEGGMGVVYRAKDTKLNREVAIKVLPEILAGDSARMERFHREAQLLAQLNHPNISSIYGVEQAAGAYALVMELVEGPTLAERVALGPIPIEEALPIARQIAEALEAAHEKGIIHRDLKPANVKVRPDGTVKVLDFGLAKALEGDATSKVESEHSPTLTVAATLAGVIMGTAAYMSPEQARGQEVDKRSDIWSFGVVLYEMLTGRQLFGGKTVSDSLAGVLKTEIDFTLLGPETPPTIRRLLRRSLERDAKHRLRDIGEARIAIEEQLADPTGASVLMEAPAVPAQPARWSELPWIAAGVVTVALITALAGWWREAQPVEQPLHQFEVDLGSEVALDTGLGASVILSPDGNRLVFVSTNSSGERGLYTRQLGVREVTALAGTEGALSPFFSPDNQWVGFFAGDKLKKISVSGGAAVTVCGAPDARGGSWGEDGYIVLGHRGAGLSRVPAAGGTPEPLTQLDRLAAENTHRWPQVLPGAKAVLFVSRTTEQTGLGQGSVEVLSLESSERKSLQPAGGCGRYLNSGHLVYVNQDTLFAAPMDLDRLELLGPPAPVLEDVATEFYYGGAQFDFSQTGSFAYLRGGVTGIGFSIRWLDETGETRPLLEKSGFYIRPTLSPDGKRLAVTNNENGNWDIWVYEWERDTLSRLTFSPAEDGRAIWTPDGAHLLFRSTRDGGARNIYVIRADGASEAHRLTESTNDQTPVSLSPDGKRLAFHEGDPETGQDIWTLPLEGGETGPIEAGEAEIFLRTPATEVNGEFSPDGRWMAYMSNESGAMEVYVRPFPGPGGKWQISNGGGSHPVWSPNGRELFYGNPGQQIMVAEYAAEGDSFRATKPRLWSATPLSPFGTAQNYDLSPDGKRFAVLMAADETGEQEALHHVTFLQNFFDELKRRAPVGGGAGE